MDVVNKELDSPKFKTTCPPAYLAKVRDFTYNHIVMPQVEARKSRGMFDALERHEDWDDDTDLSLGASGIDLKLPHFAFLTMLLLAADKAIVKNKSKVTDSQLRAFLELCWAKYAKARIEPGWFKSHWPITAVLSAHLLMQDPLSVPSGRNLSVNQVPR